MATLARLWRDLCKVSTGVLRLSGGLVVENGPERKIKSFSTDNRVVHAQHIFVLF